MINRNTRTSAPAWQIGVRWTLIFSMILACPGPGLYTAFAQGSSSRAKAGGTSGHDAAAINLIRSDVADVTRVEEIPSESVDQQTLDLSLVVDGVQPAAMRAGAINRALATQPE